VGLAGWTLSSGSTPISMDAATLCDYCDQPWYSETGLGRLCRRHYGYLELATVICYPERIPPRWAYKRGAKLRRSA
jgi:hypothetical protein